ncbi:hypothetical protein BgiMline_012480 [Biomphalaria glabrata]|nr:hypothetical protein BgiMline_016364 [Biomphalaria glabrata]
MPLSISFMAALLSVQALPCHFIGTDKTKISSVDNDNTTAVKDTIITCESMCGQWSSTPCSCDHRCLVLGNCCERFASDCSETARESKNKYALLLHSKVSCDFDAFVISSCPEDGQLNKNVDNVNNVNSKPYLELLKNTQTININNRLDLVDSLQSTTPVTDLSTGFTFINKTIYDCNKWNDSVPALWTRMVGLINFNIKENSLAALNVAENKFDGSFRPPSSLGKYSLRPACSKLIVTTCELQNYSRAQLEKCTSFVSHVHDGHKVYKNRHCAECSGAQRILPGIPGQVNNESFHGFNFPMMISLSENIITFSINNIEARPAWDVIECDLRGANKTDEELACLIKSCSSCCTKRPDGLCKKKKILNIALPFYVLNTEMRKLGEFIHCFLTNVVKLDVFGESKITKVKNMKQLRGTFYLFEILIFEFSNFSGLSHGDISRNYLSLAVEMFQLYSAMLTNVNQTHDQQIQRLAHPNRHSDSAHVCIYVSDKTDVITNKETDKKFRCIDVFSINVTQHQEDSSRHERSVCFHPASTGCTLILARSVVAVGILLAQLICLLMRKNVN